MNADTHGSGEVRLYNLKLTERVVANVILYPDRSHIVMTLEWDSNDEVHGEWRTAPLGSYNYNLAVTVALNYLRGDA